MSSSNAMSSSSEILNAHALLVQAQAETGLRDYGDETLPNRFGQAVSYLQSQGMDEAGQRAAASVCVWLLTSRLQLIEDRRRYPIAAETIEKPLFATGEPRSGTRRPAGSQAARQLMLTITRLSA